MKNTYQLLAGVVTACALLISPMLSLTNTVIADSTYWIDPTGDRYQVSIDGFTTRNNAVVLTLDEDNGDGRVSCPSVVQGQPVTRYELHAFGNNFSTINSVDMSVAQNLESLGISGVNITNINLNSCSNLRQLELYLCYSLTSLDFSGCPNLSHVYIAETDLLSVDISHNPKLLDAYLLGGYSGKDGAWETFDDSSSLCCEGRNGELVLITGQNYMFRMYNPNSGEHFYTNYGPERYNLLCAGWYYEGIAWIAPMSGTPVYRLYNPNAGDHHYTPSTQERDNLINAGWNFEGIGWYSTGSNGIPLHRLYNPNATGAGAHHYTTSTEESNYLQSLGWRYEGIGWYGM